MTELEKAIETVNSFTRALSCTPAGLLEQTELSKALIKVTEAAEYSQNLIWLLEYNIKHAKEMIEKINGAK